MTLRAPAFSVMLLVLSGCGSSEQPDVSYQLVDRFDVGSGLYVRALAVEEAANKLWVGTSMGVMAIDLLNQQLVDTFTRKDGLANEYVFAIGIDSRGFKWFGTNAGGASRYKEGSWDTYFPMHGLADYWIYSFAEQAGDQFWIGTWDGANRVDLRSMEFTTFKDELINEWVYGLAVDSRNRVWFGTEGGVSMLDDEAWTHWTHADGIGVPNDAALPESRNTGLGTRTRHDLSVLAGGQETYNPSYIFSTFVDADDTVWVGTWGGGVSRYDDGRWKNLSMRDGLAGNIVYSIAQDHRGAYWFGTNRGVSRYDGRDFQTYDRQSGLPAEHVYAIAVTPNDDVWVGTLNGVARFSAATGVADNE